MSVATAIRPDEAGEVSPSEIRGFYPLVLDLDGTLLRTDLLLECALQFVRTRPLRVFLLLWWALHGIAYLKQQLAERAELAIDLLPVNEALAAYAQTAADNGREVIIATAANQLLAQHVCDRFDFAREALASTAELNLKGKRKAEALAARYPDGFVYAGDAAADLHVWRAARFAIFAGDDAGVFKRVKALVPVEAHFQRERAGLTGWMKALRVHQWAKNGLIFLPMMLAGVLLDLNAWLACTLGFVAMGVTASATYLLNDLMDLQEDRRHWSKRNRALASGTIGIPAATLASIFLLGAGFGLAMLAGGLPTLALVLLYCAATLTYSLYLKRVPLLDVTVLAGLFTLRLAVGAVIVDVRLSAWLMVFSMFLFFSLALAKRSIELTRTISRGSAITAMHGRGYVPADAPFVSTLGVSSALTAVAIMVLYLIHEAFPSALYSHPEVLWAAPVLIGLWLGRIWLLCTRGQLNDDPVQFTVHDRVSILLGAGVMCSFAGAALLL